MKIKILVFFLFLSFLIRIIHFSILTSLTVDETVHITAGYFYVNKGDFLINYEHPPLVKTLSGLFLSFVKINCPDQVYKNLREEQYSLGKVFFYINKDKIDKIVFLARTPLILISLLLGFLIFLWTKDLYGLEAGIFGLFLFTFCPNFLGHSCLVTTDVPFTTFFIGTLYFLWKFFEINDKKYIYLFGFFLGFSISTKFTGIILLPFIIFVLLFYEYITKDKNFFKKNFIDFLISFLLIPLFITAFCYQFYGIKTFIYGLKQVLFETTKRGHIAYLNGNFSLTGWRHYFILAFIYKTPFALIILFLISFLIKPKPEKKEIFVILPALIYFIFSSLSKKQIGIRYIFPFYALFYIYVSRLFFYYQNIKIGSKLMKIGIWILIFWYSFASLRIHPHYIAFFNEIIGGPENGWKYLLDSNIDWGQDLKKLRNYLIKEDNPEIMLNYFGSVFPETYGIIHEPVFETIFFDIPEKYYYLNSDYPKKEYFAISVNQLLGLVYIDHSIFHFLLNKRPIKKIGYSIFVYDITKDIEIREKLLENFEKYGFKRQAERQRKIIEKLRNNLNF
ncbi:MAG: glycosyltransferase family 39 protein [Candidatus Aenigmatarchaeota archaeon]